jgi:hypothetical protein
MRLEGLLPKSRCLRNIFRKTLSELGQEGDEAECPYDDSGNILLTFDNVRVEACSAPFDTRMSQDKIE